MRGARVRFLTRRLVAAPVPCLLKWWGRGMWLILGGLMAFLHPNPDKCDGLGTTIPPDLASAQPRAAPSPLRCSKRVLLTPSEQQKQNVLFHLR